MILMFLGGVVLGSALGVISMCCFIISGRESKKEEKSAREQ